MQLTTPPRDFSLEIPSVNFHLWEPCNMKCRFCFATFQDVKQEMDLPKGHLPKADHISVIDQISEFGLKKINFAGGEPMLCPWLPDLIVRAKEHGLVTSIVTNGSKITDQWLKDLNGNLDWVGLSIDTVDSEKLIRLGRAIRGKIPITEEKYLNIIGEIRRYGIRLKINTVVTSVTWEEDFTSFIRLAKPERWKLLQALPVKGQNDEHIDDFIVTPDQFDVYVQHNRIAENDGVSVVPESNEAMTESYIMIDPAGRFFDNADGFHTYSDPILEVGMEKALEQVSIDPERFRQRGGEYEW